MEARLWPGYVYDFDPTILRVNRQIYKEARTVLYDENMLVRVRCTNDDIGLLLDSKGIPIVLEGLQAAQFKHAAMSVDFEFQNTTAIQNSQGDNLWYVIASDDTQRLWQGLASYSHVEDNALRNYKLKVNVHRVFGNTLSEHPTTRSPQYRLLESFTALDSVPYVEFTGSVDTKYCTSIAARIYMAPTLEKCFDQIIKLKRKGKEHYRLHDLEGAIKIYKTAISQLFSDYCPRTLDIPDWAESHPQQFEVANDTKVHVITQLAVLHYSLKQFEDAYFWACEGTYDGPGTQMVLHGKRFAKKIYIKGMSSIKLGNYSQGVDELCDGLKLVEGNVRRHPDLVHLRREAIRMVGLHGRALEAMGLR